MLAKSGMILLAVLLFCPAAGKHLPMSSSLPPLPVAATNQLEVELAQQLQQTTESPWAEWLGPLAPVALSPFFGITCLAGIAQFGGDLLPANQFLQNSVILKNSWLFWVLLVLTLITSLPRLSKVSKPVAQAIDLLETYSGIILILLIKFMPIGTPGGATVSAVNASSAMFQMGVIDFSMDMLFAVAAVLNVLVINTVKFFFETLVWLIPVPTIDAMLEAGNKLVCGGLMAIYCYSPTLAAILNLIIFLACAMVFAKISRRVRQMRSLITEPLLSLVSKGYAQYDHQPLVVFNQQPWEGFPAYSRMILKPVSDGWELHGSRYWVLPRMAKILSRESKLILGEGMFVNTIEVQGAKPVRLTFSRRYRNQTDKLCGTLKISLSQQDQFASSAGEMKPEFS
jgi:hypothetical protein